MRIVSFDVGLRNLAFCVLEGTTRTDIKVFQWDLIDVMAEMNGLDKPLCVKCKKPACWKNKDTYACSRHKGSQLTITKTNLMKQTREELMKLGEPMNITGKTKKELADKIFTKSLEGSWKRCVKSSKTVSVVDLAQPIADSLNVREEIWKNADMIVFEQQPDKRMLCIQGMLHMWFVSKGYACKGVSAVHKLTNIANTKDIRTYKDRKKEGIVHANELLPNEDLKKYMMKHPKKDDLADCFLQGVWFIENGKFRS